MSTMHNRGLEVRHPLLAINLESLAIATILKDFGATHITAAQIDSMAHVFTQAELQVGYAALIDPFMTPYDVKLAITELTIYGPSTSAGNAPVAIPSLYQDAVAAQLVGIPGFHLAFSF